MLDLFEAVGTITTALKKEAAILTEEARRNVCSAAFWFEALMFSTCFRFHGGALEHRGPISAKGKIRQRSRNLDELFEDAREVHWYFQEWVRGWSKGIAEHIPGPVKNPPRAISKAIRVYDRDVGLLTDLVRCTVVCDTLDDVLMFVCELIERAFVGETISSLWAGDQEKHAQKKVRITSLKNRFHDDYDSSITQGYRDLSLGVEVSMGLCLRVLVCDMFVGDSGFSALDVCLCGMLSCLRAEVSVVRRALIICLYPLQVCWLRHESGLEFLPASKWGEYKNEKRHICEIQVHLRSIIEVKRIQHCFVASHPTPC